MVSSKIVGNREKADKKKKKQKTNYGKWRSPLGTLRIKFNDVLFQKTKPSFSICLRFLVENFK